MVPINTSDLLAFQRQHSVHWVKRDLVAEIPFLSGWTLCPTGESRVASLRKVVLLASCCRLLLYKVEYSRNVSE